jgi:hypothetical protein
MINDRRLDQAYSDLRSSCGGVREDYFGLLYLEQEHKVPRQKAINQIAFGGNDRGGSGFSDGGVSGVLSGQYSNRRADIHEKAKT